MSQEKLQKLRMDFYQASDGPRLMLFGSLKGDFDSLKNVFRRLADNLEEHIQLDEESFFIHQEIVKLTLYVLREGMPKLPGFHVIMNSLADATDSPLICYWALNSEAWDEVYLLTDSLISSSEPAHQYLGQCSEDDAIIVVSKGEYLV